MAYAPKPLHQQIRLAASMSLAAYSPFVEDIKERIDRLCEKPIVVHPFSDNGCSGVYVETSVRRCIAFKGTDSIRDWYDNFNIQRTEYPTRGVGTCHGGYLHNVQRVLDTLGVLVRTSYQSKPLLITGHSKGGGEAQIAAMLVYDLFGLAPQSVITFGSPKVLSWKLAKLLDEIVDCYSFTNNNDVVARVPLFRYSRPGVHCHFSFREELLYNPSFWVLLKDRYNGRMESIYRWESDGVQDHSMTRYHTLVNKTFDDLQGA